MSETKFTPGPWRLGRSGFPTVHGEGGIVALVYDGSNRTRPTEEEDKTVVGANAHLIAAAPAMYAALEAVIEACCPLNGVSDTNAANLAHDIAADALAAARGSQEVGT